MKLSVNHKYMIVQGLFWMLYCVAVGFISLCLQSRGLSNQEIGIVTAVFGSISAFLQPILGRICDKYSFLTFKEMLLTLSCLFFAVCILMTIFTGKVPGIICVGLLLMLGNAIIPFINSALSAYQLQGESINFGVARGIGSGMYALLALLIGHLAASFGPLAVSASGIVISALFIIAVYTLPKTKQPEEKEPKSPKNNKGFIRRYPAFMLMYAAFIFSAASHNILGTYLLQIMQSFGGTSREFGIAIAIQAVLEVPVLFLFSFLLKKISVSALMVFSSAGYTIKAFWYLLATNIVSIYFVQVTQMISFALFASASVYYTISVVEKEDQVTGQAFMASVMAIGTVLGSLSGGWLLEHYGIAKMLTANVLIAGCGIILSVLSILLQKKISH